MWTRRCAWCKPKTKLIQQELVWVFAFEGRIKRFDVGHVGFQVACGHERRTQAAFLLAKIQVAHYDGHLCAQGDVIKTCFPMA